MPPYGVSMPQCVNLWRVIGSPGSISRCATRIWLLWQYPANRAYPGGVLSWWQLLKLLQEYPTNGYKSLLLIWRLDVVDSILTLSLQIRSVASGSYSYLHQMIGYPNSSLINGHQMSSPIGTQYAKHFLIPDTISGIAPMIEPKYYNKISSLFVAAGCPELIVALTRHMVS